MKPAFRRLRRGTTLLVAINALLLSDTHPGFVNYGESKLKWLPNLNRGECPDIVKADVASYTQFRALMLDNGVHLRPEGRWYVGATHSEKELAAVQTAIQTCIEQMKVVVK